MPIEKYGDQRLTTNIAIACSTLHSTEDLKTDKDIVQDLPEKQEMSMFSVDFLD